MSEPAAKDKFSFIEMLGAHPGKFALGGFVIVVLVWGFYLWQFRFGLSDSQETWGQFGDFVGGTLNSVFGFLGFLILLSSLRLQAKELEETRQELKASSVAQQMQAEHFEREARKIDHTDAIKYLCKDDKINIAGTRIFLTRTISPNRFWVSDHDIFDYVPKVNEIEDFEYFLIDQNNLRFLKNVKKIALLDVHCYGLYRIFPQSPALIDPIEKFQYVAVKLNESSWIADLKFFGKHDLPFS